MCQVFLYTDPSFDHEVCSMAMPVPPRPGEFVRVRMTIDDEWEMYRVLSLTTEILRTGPYPTKYRAVVEKV